MFGIGLKKCSFGSSPGIDSTSQYSHSTLSGISHILLSPHRNLGMYSECIGYMLRRQAHSTGHRPHMTSHWSDTHDSSDSGKPHTAYQHTDTHSDRSDSHSQQHRWHIQTENTEYTLHYCIGNMPHIKSNRMSSNLGHWTLLYSCGCWRCIGCRRDSTGCRRWGLNRLDIGVLHSCCRELSQGKMQCRLHRLLPQSGSSRLNIQYRQMSH